MTENSEPIHELGIQDAEGNFTALAALDYDTVNDELSLKHLQQNVELRTDGTSWNPNAPLGDETQPVPGTSHFNAVQTGLASIGQVHGEMLNASQPTSIPNDSSTQLEYDTISEEDSDVVYVDPAEDRIVILKAGTFFVKGFMDWNTSNDWSTGDRIIFRPMVNGVFTTPRSDTVRKVGTQRQAMESGTVIKANANDTVAFEAYQNSGVGQEIRPSTTTNGFSVTRLG